MSASMEAKLLIGRDRRRLLSANREIRWMTWQSSTLVRTKSLTSVLWRWWRGAKRVVSGA
jgi:hypothetical protein